MGEGGVIESVTLTLRPPNSEPRMCRRVPSMKGALWFPRRARKTKPSLSISFYFLRKQLLSRTQRQKWEAGKQRKILHSKKQPVGPLMAERVLLKQRPETGVP